MQRRVEREAERAEPTPGSAVPHARRGARAITILTIAFALFLLGLVALANSGVATRQLLALAAKIPGRDKTVHFALMGTMSLLLNLAWRGARWKLGALPSPLVVPKGSALVALVVTAEEFTQKLVPVRSFSLEDLAYDYLGIAVLGTLGMWIAARIARRASREGG